MVSHLFYADDLALISYTEEGLNRMLEDLKRYADRKGLTVNAAKSEVVVFNTRSIPLRRRTASQGNVRIWFDGCELAIKAEFKYLGFRLHNTLNMDRTHAPRATGLMAATREVTALGRELGLNRSPWAMVKLFQTYVVPSGMYGCQVWGTRYARFSRIFESDVSKRHLCFLKRLLGVPYSTSNWAVLAEVNCRPSDFYWVRALCRFHARLLASNSPLLTDVAKADAALAAEGAGNCWSAEFGRALESIAVQADDAELGRGWCDSVFAGTSVNTSTVLHCLEKAYSIAAWGGFDQVADLRGHFLARQESQAAQDGQQGQDQGQWVSKSKALTYFCWFKLEQPSWPPYLRGLPRGQGHAMMKQVARFRLGAHSLRVETGRRQVPRELWGARRCQRCDNAALQALACPIDDEHHLIFDCTAFSHLRSTMAGARALIDRAAGCVRSFMSGDAAVVTNYIAACMDLLEAQP